MREVNILRLRAISEQLKAMSEDEEHRGDQDAAETIGDMGRQMEAVAEVANQLNRRIEQPAVRERN